MLRFDMRAPTDGPADIRDLYAAAIEMSEWGEQHGALSVVLSEHHASSDGYLPSPLILASAIAARTSTVAITVAALLVPLHDPVRLAEDMAVLDVISRGRVIYVAGLGYRAEEYAMFGRSLAERGRRMEECLTVLQRAWSGEAFTYDGRRVHVTPPPVTPGGPVLMYGGGSRAAARRAARFGLGFFAQAQGADLENAYRDECARVGTEPGMCVIPSPGDATTVFVAEDVDRAWQEIGPFMLHDAADVLVVAGRHGRDQQVDRADDRSVTCGSGAVPRASHRNRPSTTCAPAARSPCIRCAAALRRSSRGRPSASLPIGCCLPSVERLTRRSA